MNNGKKTMRGKTTKKKNIYVAEEGLGRRIIVGLIGAILMIVILVVAWEGFTPKYLVQYDGEKLKKEDLIYDIFQSEMIGAQMAGIYEQFGYTTNYWNMDNGDGTTTQDYLANEATQGYLYNRILYAKALEAGYAATDEEKQEAETEVTQMLEAMTEEKSGKLGLTREVLTQKTLEEGIVERYKQDMIDSFDIDDEGIKAGVNYEENRGYKIQYLYIPTTTTDEEGNTVDVDDKAARMEELKTALAKGQESGDWSKAVDEENTEATVRYATNVLTPDSETFSEELRNRIFAMENNTETDIVEEENGYYAIRMVDNQDTSVYDKAVEDAIIQAEEDAFTEYYQGLYGEHEIKIYDKNWKSVIFGSVTL